MLKHTIRTKDGDTKEVKLTFKAAIKAMCVECFGFEGSPKDCTSPLCPLFVFRLGKGGTGKPMSEERKAQAAARFAVIRSKRP